MPRINPVKPDQATGKAKELLDAVQSKLGRTPNLLTTMAQAPSVLESYLGFSAALSGSELTAGEREQIALAVAATNECDYCLAAHTMIGKGAGVSDADLAGAQTGDVTDPKIRQAIRFAQAVVEKRGFVEDSDIEAARAAGLTDGQILEVVATVVFNILTNYIHHVTQAEVDFPKVENRLVATA